MKQSPFDLYTQEYEQWFVVNQNTFESEVLALKQLIPQNKNGLEIGIGSGIFAQKLGIQTGIDPSENMLQVARKRKLNVTCGIAENLPYTNDSFDFAVFITSICFIKEPQKALNEAYRVVRKGGKVIVAFIDKTSILGKMLDANKQESKFYATATFYSPNEIGKFTKNAGFRISKTIQTLINPNINEIENPMQGSGKGGFVAIEAIK